MEPTNPSNVCIVRTQSRAIMRLKCIFFFWTVGRCPLSNIIQAVQNALHSDDHLLFQLAFKSVQMLRVWLPATVCLDCITSRNARWPYPQRLPFEGCMLSQSSITKSRIAILRTSIYTDTGKCKRSNSKQLNTILYPCKLHINYTKHDMCWELRVIKNTVMSTALRELLQRRRHAGKKIRTKVPARAVSSVERFFLKNARENWQDAPCGVQCREAPKPKPSGAESDGQNLSRCHALESGRALRGMPLVPLFFFVLFLKKKF